jgi:hypothetical protein
MIHHSFCRVVLIGLFLSMGTAEARRTWVWVDLPPAEFTQFLAQMHRQTQGKDKVALAQKAARVHRSFTCAELRQILTTTPFHNERLAIATALVPGLRDPQNYAELLRALPRMSEEEESQLMRLIVWNADHQ